MQTSQTLPDTTHDTTDAHDIGRSPQGHKWPEGAFREAKLVAATRADVFLEAPQTPPASNAEPRDPPQS